MQFLRLFTGICIAITWVGLGSQKTTGQVMVSPTAQPSSLVICGTDGTFSFLIANTTGGIMSGAILTIDLPAGVRYSPGSITGATESNILNLNQPVFALPDIQNNTAHAVSYNAGLICGYINADNFVYIVTYNSSNYTGTDTPLLNYYFPEPVITGITNASVSIPVNQTVTRDITVEQQGLNATLDTLYLLDEHTADIQVISVSNGTLHPYVGPGPLIVDTIIITGSDFPGGNGLFDPGESIVISETVKLAGCTNGQSTIKAAWGCFHQLCNFYAAFPSVSPASGSPLINLTLTGNKRGWGFIDNSGWVEFTIANSGTGAGTAFDLIILAGFSSGGSTYYPNADWLNEIDSFSVNGQYLLASFNYTTGAINGQFAHFSNLHFTTDPDGAGTGLEDSDNDGFFNDLPAGRTVTIKAHTYYDWPEAISRIPSGNNCGSGWTNSAYQSFRFGYDFKNQCNVQFGVNWVPNGNLIQFQTYNTFTTQHTIPPDIFNGVTVWMEHLVTTGTAVASEGCPLDSVYYQLILPPGIILAPGTATFKGVSMGTPTINGDTVRYLLDRTRILSGGLFRVPVTADCEINHPPTGSIRVSLKFWCDRTNYKERFFTYWCSTSPVFGIQCPPSTCTSPYISSLRVSRTTLGWTNNLLTSKVNSSSPGLRLDNALSRDSIKIEAAGQLNGPVDSLYFRLQHDALPGGWGNRLFFDYLTDTLYFYDIETDTRHTCTNLSPLITNGATSVLQTYFGDLTSGSGCLNGLSFSAGDSLHYVIHGMVKNVAQTEWRTVPAFRGNFYWKEMNLPTYCNDRGVTFNVLGSNYPFTVTTFYQQIVLQACSSFVYEGLISRNLDVCGGDIAFPNEIRPFFRLDTMIFTLPEGFTYQPGSARHSYNIDNTSAIATEIISDPMMTVNATGTKLTFIRNISWSYSDYYDCSSNYERIIFNATPSCKATGNFSYIMDGRGRYQFYADGIGIRTAGISTKAITYTAPLVSLTPLITTAEGREDTVIWKVRLCNIRSFDAVNCWIAFENLSAGIQIVDIKDISVPANPINIPFTLYGPGKIWAQLGSLTGSACQILKIRAIYSSCSFDSLQIRHGYNCAGFPLNPELGYSPSGYLCTENESYLYLDPKDVSLNLTVTSPVNPVNLCNPLQYEVEVTNSQLSSGYNLKLIVATPPGVTFLPGQSQLKFPNTTGSYVNIGDPVNQPSGSNKWVFNISTDPNGIPVLKGVDSIPRNGYLLRFHIQTDCNFISGTSLKITASAENACGEEKSRTSYGSPILIDGLPSNVNLYVISTNAGAGFYTCSNSTLVKVKVINLGPSLASNIEKLGVFIDDAFDYVSNSLVGIHNGPSGLATNLITGGIRYLYFQIQPNLPVNDSIVFTFQLHDIDPGSLQCDTISMETSTLLVAQVACATAPGGTCIIQSITHSITTEKPVFKDNISFGTSPTASSVPNGTTGEIITVNYRIRNTGSVPLRSSNIKVVFVHDANNNGLADDTGADSLFTQTFPVANMAAGDSISCTSVFTVPAAKICQMLASLRLQENGCICSNVIFSVNPIALQNAGANHEVCEQISIPIGSLGITGYNYIWVPSAYLNSYTISDPIFTYTGMMTQPDTINYVLTTTRPGGCINRDTTRIIVLPPAQAFAGEDATICSGDSYLLTGAIAMNSLSVHWSTSGTGGFSDPDILNPVYSPGPADFANGSVQLTLTVPGLCGTDVDAMILSFIPRVTVSAGPDVSICQQATFMASAASASNHNGLLWTSSGDGGFSDPLILQPIYTPGVADIALGTVTLTLSATGNTPCPVVSDAMILQLNPPPLLINNPLQKTICSGTSTNILPLSNQPGTTFSWTASATLGNVTGFNPGSGPVIDDILINADASMGSATYSIIPGNNGCIGQAVDYLVMVKPSPAVTNAPPEKRICSETFTNIPLQSSLPGVTTYSWTATGNAPDVTGFSDGAGTVINQNLKNNVFNDEFVFYHITPVNDNCTGQVFDYTVTVTPVPDVYFTPSTQTICGGNNCTIALLSHAAGSTFSWSASGSSGYISGFNPGSGLSINQTLFNTGISVETANYFVSPEVHNCPGTPGTVIVTVNPLPVVTFLACNDVITTTIAKPFNLRGGLPPGGTYSGPGVNPATGVFTPSIAGAGNRSINYTYSNYYSCPQTATLNVSVVNPPFFNCGNLLTDIRNGNIYPTAQFGTQCWMAANLNYGSIIYPPTNQIDNCTPEKFCSNNSAVNCTKYGGLYQWDELMSYGNAPASQGLCPPGWHVPTANEWNNLTTFFNGNSLAGSFLKDTLMLNGFNALLGGLIYLNGTPSFYDDPMPATIFWSSTPIGINYATARGLNLINKSASFYPGTHANAFSVRCLRD